MLTLTKMLNYLDVMKNYDFIVTVLLVLVCVYWLDTYLYVQRTKRLIRKMLERRHQKRQLLKKLIKFHSENQSK